MNAENTVAGEALASLSDFSSLYLSALRRIFLGERVTGDDGLAQIETRQRLSVVIALSIIVSKRALQRTHLRLFPSTGQMWVDAIRTKVSLLNSENLLCDYLDGIGNL